MSDSPDVLLLLLASGPVDSVVGDASVVVDVAVGAEADDNVCEAMAVAVVACRAGERHAGGSVSETRVGETDDEATPKLDPRMTLDAGSSSSLVSISDREGSKGGRGASVPPPSARGEVGVMWCCRPEESMTTSAIGWRVGVYVWSACACACACVCACVVSVCVCGVPVHVRVHVDSSAIVDSVMAREGAADSGEKEADRTTAGTAPLGGEEMESGTETKEDTEGREDDETEEEDEEDEEEEEEEEARERPLCREEVAAAEAVDKRRVW